MRPFASIPVLSALAVVVAGVAVLDGSSKREFIDHPARDTRAVTNAELLRRGVLYGHAGALLGGGSGGGGFVNRRNNDFLGFISSDISNGVRIDPNIKNALCINFDTGDSSSGSELDIFMTNSVPSWPILGLVQGSDSPSPNLVPGSFNFLNLAGVSSPGTPPGSPPTLIDNSAPPPLKCLDVAPAETAVWSFNASTKGLAPQWINIDGSAPPGQLFIQNEVVFVGDPKAFQAKFSDKVTVIDLVFIPK